MKFEHQPKVYTVILNWNGWKDTIECLESVLASDYANMHTIVCDNDSSDRSLDYIERWANSQLTSEEATVAGLKNPPSVKREYNSLGIGANDRYSESAKITLIQTGSNLGFAGGNNVGIRHALALGDCDFVWLLNNDATVEPDALTNMVNHSQSLLDKGIKNTCGSVVCFYDKPEMIQALGGSTYSRWTGVANDALGKYKSVYDTFDHEEISRKMQYINGCSWLVPKSFLDEIGLLEEGYFLYYEEADWAKRSAHLYKLTYAPDARVYHKGGNSIGSRKLDTGPSVQADYFMARSRRRFMHRFYPKMRLVVWGSMILQSLNRLRQGKPDNALALLKIALGIEQKRQFKN